MAVLEFEELAVEAIESALSEGYSAASWGARDDGLGGLGRTALGGDVVVARLVAGGQASEIVPLRAVWDAVAAGRVVEDVRRPDPSFVYWEGVAIGHIDPFRHVIVHVRDRRGMAGALLARTRGLGDEELGQRWTSMLLSSAIAGRQGRAREAARRLSESVLRPGPDLRTIAAGALAEYFARRATSDGGSAVCEWVVMASDLRADGLRILASSGGSGDGDRRSQLNEAVLGAVEAEAFGVGSQSTRSRWSFAELDGELEDERSADQMHEVDVRLTVDAVIGAAGLSGRERECIELTVFRDLTNAEAARQLGIAEGTVKATIHRAMAKIRKSA